MLQSINWSPLALSTQSSKKEHYFGQANSITGQTSINHHNTSKMQSCTSRLNPLTPSRQLHNKMEVSRPASAWENLPNTLITTEFMQQTVLNFRAIWRVSVISYSRNLGCGGGKHHQVSSSLMVQLSKEQDVRVQCYSISAPLGSWPATVPVSMLGDMHWQPDQHPFSTIQKYTSEGD